MVISMVQQVSAEIKIFMHWFDFYGSERKSEKLQNSVKKNILAVGVSDFYYVIMEGLGQYVSHIEPEKESYHTVIAEVCNEGEECSHRK